jgi:hypothetical protein
MLGQFGVAGIPQDGGGMAHGVIGGRAGGDIIKQGLVHGKTSVI